MGSALELGIQHGQTSFCGAGRLPLEKVDARIDGARRSYGWTSRSGAALLLIAGEYTMADTQVLLFDERFLDRHAGAIITDAEIAIVELVANAWDAWARRVDIHWAEKGDDKVPTIRTTARV
ncbi:MAG: hypothetical protein P0Y52_04715 [Candidatus Brevundimonas phytovorans]|nr:hypothetical protein [Brevundimonas sp.]WEK58840.1 MAG: hypothetical protein P0Y52_04715 [Brevundimonas sp.]